MDKPGAVQEARSSEGSATADAMIGMFSTAATRVHSPTMMSAPPTRWTTIKYQASGSSVLVGKPIRATRAAAPRGPRAAYAR